MNDLAYLQCLTANVHAETLWMSDRNPMPATLKYAAERLAKAAKLAEQIAARWAAEEREYAGLTPEGRAGR